MVKISYQYTDEEALNIIQTSILTFTKAIHPNLVALTDGANISVDASAGNFFTVTLAGDRTLDNPTNLGVGYYTFIVTQDGTGARTLAYGNDYRFPGSVEPVLSTSANAVDTITFISDGTVLHLDNVVQDLKA
tara:strand:- start:1400 stop:1798 length:399 start_codon:yes stop_codon:yes gene_type:complete